MWKKIIPYLVCVLVLLAVSCIFFSPVLDGKKLRQVDQMNAAAVRAESNRLAEKTGQNADWISSMFCGMPSYQTSVGTPDKGIVTSTLRSILTFNSPDLGIVFLYMFAFFIALICLGLNPLLALFGAIGFGLGSYNMVLIYVGHLTKARCIAMILPIFCGMMLCLNSVRDKVKTGQINYGRLVTGIVMFAVALILQISFSHIQITYYTMLGAVVLGLVYFVVAIKEKWVKYFVYVVMLFSLCGAIAVACNARTLFATLEYSKYTMRGGSDITVSPEVLYDDYESSDEEASGGLGIDYAYSWSCGIGETYTMMVPGAMGGSSDEQVDVGSATYRNVNYYKERAPLYWGDQPFMDAPVYLGVIVVFLFFLGLFVVKGPDKWWLLIATLLAVMLAWGRNFMPFNEWMFNFLPLYNKFRTPSMALTLASVTMSLMAVMALKSVIDNQALPKKERRNMMRPLYISGGITAGILLIGIMLSGTFSYVGLPDEHLANEYKENWASIQNSFIHDRKALFVSDSWRSLLFVALAFGVLWLFISDKLKKAWMAVAPLTVLVLIDLWSVDRRYIAEADFVNSSELQLHPEPYDAEIDRQAAANGDVDYRVLNYAVNTFKDANPSAFHHQIGGYSAVKLSRFQDIIDFYIRFQTKWSVLAMLNTRYVVTPDNQVHRNPNALGNCWFVDGYRYVPDPNGEILALNEIDPARTAVIDSSQWAGQLDGFTPSAPAAGDFIEEEYQTPYNTGYLRYKSHSQQPRIAVFSEVFYRPDWFVYIDGKRADYFRADYILRAMIVPAGDHVIEFRNEAPLVHKLNNITLISQIIATLIIIALIVLFYSKKRKNSHAIKPARL